MSASRPARRTCPGSASWPTAGCRSTTTRCYGPLIATIKVALERAGRDPARFRFRARFPYVTDAAGQPSLSATFERVPELVRAGLTDIEVYPIIYLRSTADTELEDVIARCAELMRRSG